MNRLGLELGFSGRRLHQLGCFREMEIDEFAAAITDCVIVPIGFAIVAAGTIAKADLVHQASFFQVAQRIVDGRVADAGETPAGRFEYIAGGRVVFAFENDLKHGFPLRRQFMLAGFLCSLHSGFRLILNFASVKRSR